MIDPQNRPSESIDYVPTTDRDIFEPSPSAGYRTVYAVLDVDAADLEVGR